MQPAQLEVTEHSIFLRAKHLHKNPALIFAEYDGVDLRTPRFWDEPIQDDDDVPRGTTVDIMGFCDARSDLIGQFADAVAGAVQFPSSSVYMTALGVVSAAMAERFFVRYNDGDENTVGLYVVVAQPPSTGKSGVLSLLCNPMHSAYAEKREANKPVRSAIERKIARLKRAINKEKNECTLDSMDLELIDLEEKLHKIPDYNWAVNDATAEGCEKILSKQGGFFNVISDESSAVKVLMGMVYGDKAVNNGIFLKAWDNGFHAVARQSRDGFIGYVRGAFVVLAQDVSINAIIKAGEEGEGISERVLALEEETLLGKRKHEKKKPISRDLKEKYSDFCHWVIGEPRAAASRIVLDLEPAAEDYIISIKNKFEHLMADGGRYSSNMLRGFVGKADKQIIKLAAVLTAVKSFQENKPINSPISFYEIERAESIFDVLLRTILKITEDRGMTGSKAEIEVAKKYCSEFVANKTLGLSVQRFREKIRGNSIFRKTSNLSKRLEEEVLPMLEALNYCVWDRDKKWINLNPRLGI